ncbi:MAG: MBL fold metallo-hydrolase, partial [Planctomycetota bacterium]
MNVIPLQSGSKGNCFYVESSRTRILVDVGITFRQASLRLQSHDREIQSVDHIFITHDHSDHARYLLDYQKRLQVPVHLTRKTNHAIQRTSKSKTKTDTNLEHINYFSAGQSITAGDITVHSIPTPHDASDCLAYIVENEQQRIGILTDMGHVFVGLKQVL